MMRIAGLIALMLTTIAFVSACSSSMMEGPTPRPASSYRMGPSGAPGELPPGVY
jgi:hypothetical protein